MWGDDILVMVSKQVKNKTVPPESEEIPYSRYYVMKEAAEAIDITSGSSNMGDTMLDIFKQLSAQEYLTLIASHAKDIFWVMDRNCNIIYISDAIYELVGFTPAEVMAAPMSQRYTPRTLKQIESWRELMTDPDVMNLGNFVLDVELLHKNGSVITCELKVSIVKSGGEVLGIVGVTRDVSFRRQAEIELTKLTIRDQLTGAYNKSFFYAQVQHEIERARRYKRPMCVLMFDLDHFKHVNDTYGHAAGDLVLTAFSQACMHSLRSYTVFGRLGGEEFGICLQEASLHEAEIVAERLRATIENLEIPLGSKGSIKVTVSIGVAMWQGEDRPEDLMAKADTALYAAKSAGRNQVAIAPII
jgi:diguanylate cyclase (GGDEF)-like protein/PAS domain S-box-containing protein